MPFGMYYQHKVLIIYLVIFIIYNDHCCIMLVDRDRGCVM